MVPQNTAFLGNPQVGGLQQQQGNFGQQLPVGSQQLQNVPTMSFDPALTSHNPSRNLQNQGNHSQNQGSHNSNGRHNQNKNFLKTPGRERSNWRSPNSKPQHINKGRKETQSVEAESSADQTKSGKQRPFVQLYTEKEIQKWREERKKNYPTKDVVQKKQPKKQANVDAAAEEDKLHREVDNMFGRSRKIKFTSSAVPSVGPTEIGSQSLVEVSSSNLGYVQVTQEEYQRNFGDDIVGEMNDTEEDVELVGDAEEGDEENVDEEETEEVVSTLRVKRDRNGKFVSIGSYSSSTNTERKTSRKTNEDWKVKVPEEGGPVIGDLIPSFGAHVSKALWSNPDARGILTPKTREGALGLLRHWDLPKETLKIVGDTKVSHLVGCMHAHLDMPLLTAFVERWQPDTNTFHFPFGEMTITLHDVAVILKISIEGLGCKISKEDMEETEYLVEDLFVLSEGVLKGGKFTYKNKPIYSGGGLLAEGVAAKIQEKKDAVELNAKAWLLVLLGSTLFSDNTSNRVKTNTISLLTDLGRVREYAWGAATLAYLYRQLGIASRLECAQICGCLTLLQSWIYEHFVCFRPHVMFDHAVSADSPRSMLWKPPSTKKDVDRLKYLRQKLDEMDPSMVTWLPYCKFPGEAHPNSLYSGFIRFLDVVEPYQPIRCLRQFGYTQIIPRPISKPDYHCRPTRAKSYVVKYGDSADDSWLAVQDHCIILHQRSTPANPCYAVCDKYIDWYRPRTHPLIIDPSIISTPVYDDRGLTESQLLQRTIAAFANVYFSPSEDRLEQLMTFYNEMIPYYKPYLTCDLGRANFGPSGRGYIRVPLGNGPRQQVCSFGRPRAEHEFEAVSSRSGSFADD